tara:strand:+ start:649 stop:1089 length:441 start_codon:yes stop_codon:yes gene_type:complete
LGKKHRMDIPRNLQVTRSSVKVEPSSAESDELQKETLAREGKEVAINRDLAANVQFIPGIQALINSSYHIIDAELLNLKRQAQAYTGLDASESKRFGLAVASLVKLAGLENDLKEQNALETLTDDQLKMLVSDTMAQAAKKDPDDG